MVAYPHLTEAQGSQRVFPLFDGGKSLRRNRPSILDARRKASGSWFVPNSKARALCQFPDLGLREPRVEQWRGYAMPDGRALPGTEVTLIIQVDAVGNGVKTMFPREARHGLKELIFAVKAATGIVTNVLRTLHLCGVNDLQRDQILPRESNSIAKLAARQAGRICDDCQHVIPENLASRPGQESGVHASGVGNQGPSQRRQDFFEMGALGFDLHRFHSKCRAGCRRNSGDVKTSTCC